MDPTIMIVLCSRADSDLILYIFFFSYIIVWGVHPNYITNVYLDNWNWRIINIHTSRIIWETIQWNQKLRAGLRFFTSHIPWRSALLSQLHSGLQNPDTVYINFVFPKMLDKEAFQCMEVARLFDNCGPLYIQCKHLPSLTYCTHPST